MYRGIITWRIKGHDGLFTRITPAAATEAMVHTLIRLAKEQTPEGWEFWGWDIEQGEMVWTKV